MLVSCFCEPKQRGEPLGAAGVFSTFGFGRKSMLGIFFEPKAKRLAQAPRRKAWKGKSRANAGVEDLNGKESAVAERQLFKPQTVLFRWRGLRGGGRQI